MRKKLTDKIAVITGGAGGIGRGIAEALLKRGACVALLDINEELLAATAAELPEGRVFTRVCDVTDEQNAAAAIQAVTQHWGGIDILVNNAGTSHRSLLTETSASVIHRVMDLNFFGAVHCTIPALPTLRERHGSIVAISSVAGFAPLIGRTGYCASKYALHGFFETLRTELRPDNVHVLMACPIFTKTAIHSTAFNGDGTRMGEDKTPKTGATPEEVGEEIAEAIVKRQRLWLHGAGSKASYVINKLVPELYEELMLKTQGEDFK
jgi:NAD(P)-dependent dehydrogenase (short-subunit alcohol dehydrogenase family)